MSRIKQIRDMLSSDFKDSFLNYALALELEKEGEIDAAIVQLFHLKKLNLDYLPLYYKLAELLTMRQEIAKAKMVYMEGIDLAQKQNNGKTLKELKEALFNLEIEFE